MLKDMILRKRLEQLELEVAFYRAKFREHGLDLPRFDPKMSALEAAFPHLAKQIVEKWSSYTCGKLIDDLILADRNRGGFPPAVLEDLLLLSRIQAMRKPDSHLNWEAAGASADAAFRPHDNPFARSWNTTDDTIPWEPVKPDDVA